MRTYSLPVLGLLRVPKGGGGDLLLSMFGRLRFLHYRLEWRFLSVRGSPSGNTFCADYHPRETVGAPSNPSTKSGSKKEKTRRRNPIIIWYGTLGEVVPTAL